MKYYYEIVTPLPNGRHLLTTGLATAFIVCEQGHTKLYDEREEEGGKNTYLVAVCPATSVLQISILKPGTPGTTMTREIIQK